MLQYLAPFIGALTIEAFHWYQLREKLHTTKYKNLMRSKPYWFWTLLFIVLGSAVALIYFEGKLTAAELVIAGAAMPTLLKKIIATFTAKQQTTLGPDDADKPKWSDYFYYS